MSRRFSEEVKDQPFQYKPAQHNGTRKLFAWAVLTFAVIGFGAGEAQAQMSKLAQAGGKFALKAGVKLLVKNLLDEKPKAKLVAVVPAADAQLHLDPSGKQWRLENNFGGYFFWDINGEPLGFNALTADGKYKVYFDKNGYYDHKKKIER